jgi:hypothetical protein
MSAGLLVQWLVVGLLVLASVAWLVAHQWPRAVDRARRALVIWLLRPARAAWMRRLGRVLAPAATVQLGMGGSGCGSCSDRVGCANGDSH